MLRKGTSKSRRFSPQVVVLKTKKGRKKQGSNQQRFGMADDEEEDEESERRSGRSVGSNGEREERGQRKASGREAVGLPVLPVN
jgi:hypothetical protein